MIDSLLKYFGYVRVPTISEQHLMSFVDRLKAFELTPEQAEFLIIEIIKRVRKPGYSPLVDNIKTMLSDYRVN